jgi:hypothetical protein
MRFNDRSGSESATNFVNLGKSAMETLPMIRYAFGEESMGHTRVSELKCTDSSRSKEERQMKS